MVTANKPVSVVAAALAEWEAFENRAHWYRNMRGNLTRDWGGETLTVFKNRYGKFAWAVNYEGDVRYTRGTYRTEQAAMESLGHSVGVGQ